MKPRYISITIVLMLINYLIFATLFVRLMAYDFTATPEPQKINLPTFTPAPAQPQLIIPTPVPVVPVSTPVPTAVVSSAQAANLPSSTLPPPPIEASLIAPGTINIRSGPGTNFDVIGTLNANVSIPVTGRNADDTWWQIEINNGSIGWVSDTVVQVSRVNNVPIIP